LRTNCTAAVQISSSATDGSTLKSLSMLRHISGPSLGYTLALSRFEEDALAGDASLRLLQLRGV
jgi:hypothetical protein